VDSLASKSVDIIKLLLLVGIAYTVATTLWYFISGPTTDAVVPVSGARTIANPNQPQITWQDIARINMFGVVGAQALVEAPPEQQETAKETRLPLTLLGVFQAEHPEDSAAIVSQKGKSGQRYRIGQSLPGNAELIEVHGNYVVLRRAGVRETLTFPKSDDLLAGIEEQRASNRNSAVITPPDRQRGRNSRIDRGGRDAELAQPATANTPQALPATAQEFVDQYRAQIDSDPAAALSSLGVEPVSSGAAEGYRLGALANSPLLRNTGLQAGDLLLSVNGQPVGDVGRDQLQLDNVLAQGSARLEIMRGERRFFVTASLK
jgi:general secretion pathway protein C